MVCISCVALEVNSLSHREWPRLGQVRVYKRAYNEVYNEKHWLRVLPHGIKRRLWKNGKYYTFSQQTSDV
jgi:hypothetical protein